MEQLNKTDKAKNNLLGINIIPGCGGTINFYMCKCPTS